MSYEEEIENAQSEAEVMLIAEKYGHPVVPGWAGMVPTPDPDSVTPDDYARIKAAEREVRRRQVVERRNVQAGRDKMAAALDRVGAVGLRAGGSADGSSWWCCEYCGRYGDEPAERCDQWDIVHDARHQGRPLLIRDWYKSYGEGSYEFDIEDAELG